MPKQKQITITFIISGGKGQALEVYPSQKLSDLKAKVTKKLLLAKDKAIIITYKNKDIFQEEESLSQFQINDKSILYVRVVDKVHLHTSHKLGQAKLKKSANMESNQLKKSQTLAQSIQQQQLKVFGQNIKSVYSINQPEKTIEGQNEAKEQRNNFNIFVDIQDNNCNFSVSQKMKIWQLKKLIQKKAARCPQYNIVLKLNNLQLQNQKCVSDYHIEECELLSCKFVNEQLNPQSMTNKQSGIKKNLQQKNSVTPKIVQSFEFFQEQNCNLFDNKKVQNLFVNHFQGFANCDLKKSQIIDDDDCMEGQTQNEEFNFPLTPQYAYNSKNFSTPFTPSIDLNINRKTFSLFQQSQVKSKVWDGQIIQTDSIAFIDQTDSVFLDSEFRSCFLQCCNPQGNEYDFQCNNQIRISDIKRMLGKLQKVDENKVLVQLEEQIVEQLNQQNFLIVDYSTVLKNGQIKWLYKVL